MSILKQKFIIALKNTLPTYLLISALTLFFLIPGTTFSQFSQFGTGFLASIFFSLAFNLLYFVPQFSGILIGLHILRSRKHPRISRKKLKWFLRIPIPVSVVMTSILIILYFRQGFFSPEADLQKLYILFVIIILMNLIFSFIMTLNIYTMIRDKQKVDET